MFTEEIFKKNKKKIKFFVLLFVFFIFGAFMQSKYNFLDLFIGNRLNHNYKYLNPLINSFDNISVNKKNYTAFKTDLNSYILENKNRGNIDSVSMYFRDLQYGPTFGIDEYARFSPASLLKLPLMIAYLELYETDKDILDVKIFFEGYKSDLNQSIPPKESAKEGIHYSISELINYIMKYSDNNAYYALLAYLEKISPNLQILRDTFFDLGITNPQSTLEETITVKSYASIFTQLFNASYFSNKETSELALNYLVDTDFKEGLVAGVPESIQIAHKFGERFDEKSGLKQLHDCGIVYYPNNPYLICIMTRGKDMEKLKKVISEISAMTYKEFDSRKID